MKIAVFVEHLPPKLGSDRRIFEIMKRLSHKHEVHFVIFPSVRILLTRGQKKESESNLHFQKEEVTANRAGVTGHFLKISPKIARIWQYSIVTAHFLTSMLIFLKATKIFIKVRPDIVVLNYPSPYTGLLGFLEGKLWRKPIVLDFNDLIAQYTTNLLNLRKNSFKVKLLMNVQHYLIRNSQKVIAPTCFIKKYAMLLGVPESEIAVIPNGVDTEDFHPRKFNVPQLRFRPGFRSEKLCVYCGRLDEWAGINIIEKICDVARTRKLNVKFLLVGDGSEKPVRKENIIFWGEAPHEKIPAILTTADVILIPFPDNEVSHAASPLKLFEGMAMQKPVIASKVSGIEEIISDGENGFLADPDNINEWVEKMEMVLNSENLAAKIGQSARRTVEERFDWNTLTNQYEEVLNEVASKHQKL